MEWNLDDDEESITENALEEEKRVLAELVQK